MLSDAVKVPQRRVAAFPSCSDQLSAGTSCSQYRNTPGLPSASASIDVWPGAMASSAGGSQIAHPKLPALIDPTSAQAIEKLMLGARLRDNSSLSRR
jgi:hypothetical protein